MQVARAMLCRAAIRSGARLFPEGISASASAPSPSATVVRSVVTEAQAHPPIGGNFAMWKRAAPADASLPSWKHKADRCEIGDIGKRNSDDVVSLFRNLEALRMIKCGDSVQKLRGAEQHHATAVLISSISNTCSDIGGVSVPNGYSAMNRNTRKPKKANHGARPCSRYARRGKKRKWGNPRR